jgi:hypothetical protein
MKSIKKKEDKFFDLLKEYMLMIDKCVDLYHDLIHDFRDVKAKADRLSELEMECDREAHKIIGELHTSFITPFDREDIFVIVKTMDDIVDNIEMTASWFVIFDTQQLKSGAIEMADLLKETISELCRLFAALPEFKKNRKLLYENIIEINRLENESDEVYRRSLYHLFRDEQSPVEIVKWKQLFALMEDSVDVCESIAQLTEGVVMKHV